MRLNSAKAPDSESLSDWLSWLESLSPREIELGLERVRIVLQRLALARPRRVIHVAGTNGKGSTVTMLGQLYSGRNDTVACYTSPHVVRYNERMRVQGQPLSDEQIVASLRRVESVRGDVRLTYFEFGTLAAFVAFATLEASVWVLEIGLGGRLDAVNALDPDGAVITNISLDHCDWLGPDTESIAREKAGVMRSGIPVVYAAPAPPAAIANVADALGAQLHMLGRDYQVRCTNEGWSYADDRHRFENLRLPSLRGGFQVHNAAGALTLFMTLDGVPEAFAIDSAMGNLQLMGRMQRIDTTREWLLDVAHNPRAAEVLAEALRDDYPDRRLIFVIGMLADKDMPGILRPLLPLADAWVAVAPRSGRALAARKLASQIAASSNRPCRVGESIAEGLAIAEDISTVDDLLIVTGSFFTVGPAIETLVPAD